MNNMEYVEPEYFPENMPMTLKRMYRDNFEAAVVEYFGEYGIDAIAAIMGHARHESAGTFHPQQPQIIGSGDSRRFAKPGEGKAFGPLQFEEGSHETVYREWVKQNGLKDSSRSRVAYLHSTIFEKDSLGQKHLGAGNARRIQKALQGSPDAEGTIADVLGYRFLKAKEYQPKEWFQKKYPNTWEQEMEESARRLKTRNEKIEAEQRFYNVRTIDFGD